MRTRAHRLSVLMLAALAALLGGSLLVHDGVVGGIGGDRSRSGAHLQATLRVGHDRAVVDQVRTRRDRHSARLELRGFVPSQLAAKRSIFIIGSVGVCDTCAPDLLNASLTRGRAPPV